MDALSWVVPPVFPLLGATNVSGKCGAAFCLKSIFLCRALGFSLCYKSANKTCCLPVLPLQNRTCSPLRGGSSGCGHSILWEFMGTVITPSGSTLHLLQKKSPDTFQAKLGYPDCRSCWVWLKLNAECAVLWAGDAQPQPCAQLGRTSLALAVPQGVAGLVAAASPGGRDTDGPGAAAAPEPEGKGPGLTEPKVQPGLQKPTAKRSEVMRDTSLTNCALFLSRKYVLTAPIRCWGWQERCPCCQSRSQPCPLCWCWHRIQEAQRAPLRASALTESPQRIRGCVPSHRGRVTARLQQKYSARRVQTGPLRNFLVPETLKATLQYCKY